MFVLISGLCKAQDLATIRINYVLASEDKDMANQLFEELSSINEKDSEILNAYKGATLTLKAKFAKKIKEKKEFFKNGAGLIESAIASEPDNIEIRVIRMSVQENSPKFLKYNKNIDQDKQFILTHFSGTKSSAVRKFVKEYVLESDGFSLAEKDLF